MDLINADCLDALFFLDDNSVDSVVTDPPAGINFMGKEWDNDKGGRDHWIAWMTEVLKECNRVLKPGGHALVWSIPRTSHWTGMACEDAGFEVRDQISHIFGSGFPKSLNVSKAIDKEAGAEREVLAYANRGMTNSTFSRAKQTEQGYRPDGDEYANEKHGGVITAPATDLAKQWDGWGSALKPSSEKWLLIKKKETEQQQMWYEVHEIGVNICQLLLSAFPANESLRLNLKELEQVLNTVPWNADASINTLGDLCAQTDTLQSELATISNSNIASLWNSILKELLIGVSTFTTSMASSLTIDLRILKCLLSKSMQDSTQGNATQPVGLELNAETVELFLQSFALKLSNIQITSVQSNAGSLKLKGRMDNIWLCRKPLSEKTLAKNVVKHGTGALNIDGSRIETSEADKEIHSKMNIRIPKGHEGFDSPWKSDENALKEYVEVTSEIRREKLISQGRWPSHTIFSEDAAEILGESARFFYTPKASKSERNKGCEGLPLVKLQDFADGTKRKLVAQAESEKNPNLPRQNFHPTVKPIKLMEYLIKLITPPNGTVLDPFMGSGSTGVAAKNLGMNFIGIEQQQEYFEIAKRRLGV